MSWTILLSAPSMEFKIRDTLTLGGTPAYVPVEFRSVKCRKPVPIAPGYVFAETHDWGGLRCVEGLRSRPILLIMGRVATLTQEEVNAIEALSKPISSLRSDTGTRYKPGDLIAIKRGALVTLNALVTRITKDGKPIAIVEMLGKQHEIVVTEDMVA
ncbi:MAG: hypothetical protein RLZZ227_1101 [Pseudomonadota bacterium]|jgi:hypothetical protein